MNGNVFSRFHCFFFTGFQRNIWFINIYLYKTTKNYEIRVFLISFVSFEILILSLLFQPILKSFQVRDYIFFGSFR